MHDLVLKVLHDYGSSPFNPNNDPVTRTQLANLASVSPKDAESAADALVEEGFAEKKTEGPEPTYRVTGKGVVFVRNIPQGLASVW